jgi:hypothetical protein
MEQVVGIFVGLAVLVFACGFIYYVWYTAARKGWFLSKVPYFTVLESAEGINVGDPITLAGFEVGEVTAIDAEPPGAEFPVFLAFRIRDPYYGYVWSDSKVRITAAELFGRRKIEVMTGREGQPTVLEEDGRVEKMLVGGAYVPFENAPKGAFVPPGRPPRSPCVRRSCSHRSRRRSPTSSALPKTPAGCSATPSSFPSA